MTTAIVLVPAVVAPPPAAADPLPLGLGPCIDSSGTPGCSSGDTNINTFVGGNLEFGSGWSEGGGRTVVMGNLRSGPDMTTMGAYVGPGVQPASGGVIVAVGGDYSLQKSVQVSGGVRYAGTLTGGFGPGVVATQDPDAVAAYAGYTAALQTASQEYAKAPATGTFDSGTATFTGTNNPTLEVFNVPGANLSGAIRFTNISPTATVLVNVQGGELYPGYGRSVASLSFNSDVPGVDHTKLLWNIFGAPDGVTISGTTAHPAFEGGSILVGDPAAATNISVVNTNGRLYVAGDLTLTAPRGGGEIHANVFNGINLPPSAPVTDGQFVVNKVVSSGNVLVDTVFTVHWDCGNGKEGDVDITVAAGASTGSSAAITGIPDSSNCNVTEPNPPAGYDRVSVVPQSLTIDATTTDQSVTVTNALRTGNLIVNKTVDLADPSRAWDFTVTVDCGGGTPADGDQTITVAAGGTTGAQTFQNIPVGRTCTVTEPSPPAGFTLGAITDNQAGNAAGTVTIVGQSATTAEVTVANTRQLGRIDVAKTGTGAAVPTGGVTFSAHLDCPGTTWDQDVPLALPNTGPASSTAIPVGMTCTVSEDTSSLPPGWSLTSPTTPSSVVVDDDAAAEVTITNNHDVGRVQVNKVVDRAPAAATTFTIRLSCGAAGNFDVPVTVTPPATTGSANSPDIPATTRCTASEPALPDGWAFQSVAPTGGVAVIAGGAVPIVVSNAAVQFSSFDIVKNLADANSTLDGGGTFTFSVDCDDDAYDTTATLTVPSGQASGTVTVPRIPTGVSCTVAETASAPAGKWVQSGGMSVNPVVLGTDASTTATNVRQAGQVTLRKTITGDTPPAPVSFTLNLDCTGTAFDSTHTLTVTPPATTASTDVAGLPVGLSCFVTEPAVPTGWTRTAITGAAVTVPGAGSPAVELGATNDYQTGTVRLVKNVVSKGAAATVTGDTDFSLVLDCTGTAFDGPRTVTVADGQSTGSLEVSDVPRGSTCTVSEPVQPTGFRFASASGQVTVGDGTTVELTVTDEKLLFGRFTLRKELSGDFLDGAASFSFDMSCSDPTYDDTLVIDTPGLASSASITVGPIEQGVTCTVTEQPPGPGPWASAGPITPSPTITISEASQTLVQTNVRQVGSVTLTKVVTGSPPAAGQFGIRLNCSGKVYDAKYDITVTPPATTASVVVPNLPVGLQCSASEVTPLPVGWTNTSPPTPTSFTVPGAGDPAVEVTTTNNWEVRPVKLRKDTIEGTAFSPVDVDTDFTVHLTCTGTSIDTDYVLTVPAGQKEAELTVPDVPVNSVCTISEPTQPLGWKLFSYSPPSGQRVVTSGSEVLLGAVNQRTPDGHFTITKQLRGSYLDGADSFTFDVACDVPTYDQTIVVDASGLSDTASVTVGPIRQGVTCTVTEQPPGPGPWAAVSLTPSSVTIDGTDQVVTATNDRNLGQVTLRKERTGAAPSTPVDFTVRLDCTDTAYSADHVITLDPSDTFSELVVPDLPVGMRCTATEKAPPVG